MHSGIVFKLHPLPLKCGQKQHNITSRVSRVALWCPKMLPMKASLGFGPDPTCFIFPLTIRTNHLPLLSEHAHSSLSCLCGFLCAHNSSQLLSVVPRADWWDGSSVAPGEQRAYGLGGVTEHSEQNAILPTSLRDCHHEEQPSRHKSKTTSDQTVFVSWVPKGETCLLRCSLANRPVHEKKVQKKEKISQPQGLLQALFQSKWQIIKVLLFPLFRFVCALFEGMYSMCALKQVFSTLLGAWKMSWSQIRTYSRCCSLS